MYKINASILIVGLIFVVSIGHAQVIPSIPLDEKARTYNINTADNYSLLTRSDTYTFENVKVSEIANVIKQNLSVYGSISINETLNMLVIKEEKAKLDNIMELCKKLDVPQMGDFLKIRTRRVPLLYNQPSALVKFLTPYLSVDGEIQYDDNFNVIIIHDHESKLDQIEKEIKKFDVPPKEIKIDVEIVEVKKGGLLDAGINWDGILDNEITSFFDGYRIDSKDVSKSSYEDDTPNRIEERTRDEDRDMIDLRFSKVRLSDIIRILDEKQQAKVVSSPSIITLNNQEGYISVGSRIINNFNLFLSVTPHIGESELITLDIHCDVGDINSYQKIANRILVKEGETFLLGGMTKVNEVKVKKRVPILGHILPFLFSRNSTQEEVVDVVLLLTPQIIDVAKFGEQSLEVKQKLEKKE